MGGFYIDPDGNYPRHAGDIQLDHPHWEQGDALPGGWLQVAPGDFPVLAPGETLTELPPAVVDGVLTRQFLVGAI
jgi:hypothetical protein